ncbi:MAG: murein biosynthesis integral membrane protein MurJ [Microthrixaceae bacterium]
MTDAVTEQPLGGRSRDDDTATGQAGPDRPTSPRRMRTWVRAADSPVGRRFLVPPPKVEGVDWVPSGPVRFAGRERQLRQSAATFVHTGTTPVVSAPIPAPVPDLLGPVGVPGKGGAEGATMADVMLVDRGVGGAGSPDAGGADIEEDPAIVAAAERDLVRAAANPALGTILSRLTGVLRWGAMAYALGRTGLADAYGIANNTPNIIYELVVGGVLSSTLVPLFVNTRRRTRPGDTDDGASAIITVAGIALIALSTIGVLAAPWIAKAYTIGLEPGARAAQLELTVPLMRLFLPQIFLYGIVSLATAVLHSQHKLSIPAYTPIANNLVVTVMFVAARPMLDGGSASDQTLLLLLGIGTTLGVVAQALPLIAPMRDGSIRLRWNLAPTHPVVKRLIRLSGWTMGYVAANQVALYVVTNLANAGPQGTVATYQYAFAFFQLPHGLIAVSLMTAVLPRLATSFVDGDADGFRNNFREGLNVLFTVVLAASAGYVVVAEPLVQVVFQRGAFSASGTAETTRTLIAFAVGLPAFSTYLYAIRAFHARQNTRTPFWVNAAENGFNIVLALVLTTRTASGLALAFSGAYLIAAVIAVMVLNSQVHGLVERSLFTMVAKASLAAGITVVGAMIPMAPPLSALEWAPAQLLLRVACGGAAFVVAASLLRIEGLDRYLEAMRRKLAAVLPFVSARPLTTPGSAADDAASSGTGDQAANHRN